MAASIAPTVMPVPMNIDLGLSAHAGPDGVLLRWRSRTPLGGRVFYRVARDKGDGLSCQSSSGARECTIVLTYVAVSTSGSYVDHPLGHVDVQDRRGGQLAGQSSLRGRLPRQQPADRARAVSLERSSRGRTWLGLVAGGGGIVATIVAVAAARHATLADVSPVTPAGAWNAAWVICVVVALCCAVVGWILARAGALRLRAAIAVAVVIQVLPLAGPLLLSKDLYLYWAVSRIVTVHHANPYVASIDEFKTDPAFPYPSESWRPYPAAYGPVWEELATVPGSVAGTSAHRAELAYRVFAVLGILATIGLVARRTRSPAGVALLGWSPLVALHYAGGGHSDAWMMALLVLGVAAGGTAVSGSAWALAGGFKPVPVILLPLALAQRRLRMPGRWWIAIISTTALISVAATLRYGTVWLTEQARGIHRGVGYPTPLGAVHWLTQLGLAHSRAVLVAAAVFVVVYALLLREAWVHGRACLALR